jgi:hypothetical protein
MNAFISYSISENEQYILTLLAQKLGENGIILVTSYNQADSVDWQAMNDVKNSALFIGVVTKTGRPAKTRRVIQEFKQANLFNKPAVMLLEENVQVPFWVSGYENTIKFNRFFPHQAIDEVKRRISASQAQPNSNATAWILGGIGILALLSWLSEKDK